MPVHESHTHALSRDSKNLRLDDHAGLLLQEAFFRRFQTTRVHFMACVAPEGHYNKTAWSAKLILINGRPGLPCELCPSGSPTDGTALLFEFECLL